MAKQYWLQREGKMYGPYSGGKLKKLAALGRICDDDQLSADKQSWQLAGMVRGLSLCATVKPPQAASVASATPPLEVSPRTGTVSRTHNQRPSSSRYEQRFPPRPSRTKWIVIGVIGVAVVVLAVAIAVWPWMPPGESIAFDELTQLDENVQPEGSSPGKSGPVVKPEPVVKPKPVAKPKPKPVAKHAAGPGSATPPTSSKDGVGRAPSRPTDLGLERAKADILVRMKHTRDGLVKWSEQNADPKNFGSDQWDPEAKAAAESRYRITLKHIKRTWDEEMRKVGECTTWDEFRELTGVSN